MRAIVYERYGGPEVLRLVDLPKPVPRDREVLIKVRATTVTAGDWRARSLEAPPGLDLVARLFFGVSGPRRRVLGTELAGDVEAVGRGVTRFRVGDAVFAFPGAKMGCHAEYRCMPEDGNVALKPARLGYDEAAALSFGGTTALSFLRRDDVRRGEKVLVNGASGGVGTAAVQLAKHLGAQVTGVCSTANLELVRSLGADRAIDYTREDFTRSGETFDVIVDTAGTAPYSRARRSLAPGGRLLLVLADVPAMLAGAWVSMTGKAKVISGPASDDCAADLRLLAELAEAGAYTPVIDRRYPLERIAEAHRHVDAGHKRGNVVITVAGGTAGPSGAPARGSDDPGS